MSKHTISPPKFGWSWMGNNLACDEEGNEWAEIGPLTPEGHLDDEVCIVMLRNASQSERKFPGITALKQRQAKIIAEALTEYFENHGLAEGFLYA